MTDPTQPVSGEELKAAVERVLAMAGAMIEPESKEAFERLERATRTHLMMTDDERLAAVVQTGRDIQAFATLAARIMAITEEEVARVACDAFTNGNDTLVTAHPQHAERHREVARAILTLIRGEAAQAEEGR